MLVNAIRAYDNHDAAIAHAIAVMGDGEVRDLLERAVRVLRDYPKGQDDGTWRQCRTWLLQTFLNEDQCA
jgi:phosphate uptake regulator